MEEDGNYNNFLEGIAFKYNVLDSNIKPSPPGNMYDGRESCLKHGVARKCKTAFECMLICGGWDYDFSSA